MNLRQSLNSDRSRRYFLRSSLLGVLSLAMLACDSVSYYGQAARGQLAILVSRQDIESLLQGSGLPDNRRLKLEAVLRIRDFARQEMLLPAGGSYGSYVELDREHVVWNVFAAPEFSLDPVTWCYSLAGCVSYRGYFSEDAARRFAAQLTGQGYDVYVGGVDAYSTLGWFDDPLLSTVLDRADHQLAGLIFHELAHQLVYVPGDTTFNESFASTVEREGVRRWLTAQGDPGQLGIVHADLARQGAFVDLVMSFQSDFQTLYGSGSDTRTMREGKAQLQARMRQAYASLRSSWDGYGGYDRWFDGPLNNAQIGSVAAYNDLVPAMQGILTHMDYDLSRFYREIQRLAALPADEREAALHTPGP